MNTLPGSFYQSILSGPEESNTLQILSKYGVQNLPTEIQKIKKLQGTIASISEMLEYTGPNQALEDTIAHAKKELADLEKIEKTVQREIFSRG